MAGPQNAANREIAMQPGRNRSLSIVKRGFETPRSCGHRPRLIFAFRKDSVGESTVFEPAFELADDGSREGPGVHTAGPSSQEVASPSGP